MDETMIRRLLPPEGIVDAVLDTDTFNEIDDQFALAYMLASTDRIRARAVYAAPFFNANSTSPEDGMVKSYQEILTLLRLTKREDVPAFEGSRIYLPDDRTPVDSPAARDLAARAMEYTREKPLYVVAIGAITNVASALLINPEIAARICVVWLGGNALEWRSSREFNMMQDVAAARVVFDSDCALVQLPCAGVVDRFTLTEPELRYWFKGKNALCDHLADAAISAANEYAAGKPWSRVIWDVTAVAYLTNTSDNFMESYIAARPIPEYDHHYAFDPRRAPMRYVYSIKRDALMYDLIQKLAK